ncbi:MAG: TadE/TadG family type IV pilus assembly protein [Alphaproteobacteria bacterium]
MKRLSSFMQNQNGNAAVEFALVFPIMIILFMGLFEVTYYLNVSLKLSNAAQSIANMAAQQTQVTTAIATNLCDGGQDFDSAPRWREPEGRDGQRHALYRQHHGGLAGYDMRRRHGD